MSRKKQCPTWPRTNSRPYAGRRFGGLLVLAETDRRSVNGTILWECRCDCGRVVSVLTSNLTSGNTTSCGGPGCRGRHGAAQATPDGGVEEAATTRQEADL